VPGDEAVGLARTLVAVLRLLTSKEARMSSRIGVSAVGRRVTGFRPHKLASVSGILLAVVLVSGSPSSGQMGDTCTGVIDIGSTQPSFNNLGSIDRITLTFGTISITNGTKLTVDSAFFNLDCRNAGCVGDFNRDCTVANQAVDCAGFGNLCFVFAAPQCVDDGAVVGFDGNITTTCKTCLAGSRAGFACEVDGDCPTSSCTGTAITFTPSFRCVSGSNPDAVCTDGGGECMGGGTCDLNKVVFTMSPAFILPPGDASTCKLEFDVEKLSSMSNDTTPLTIEQVTGYTGVCDNSAPGAAPNISGALPIDPTPTPTGTATNTPTVTPTRTPTNTPTVTPTRTPTNTPTVTPTFTPTSTPTLTPTATPTRTPTSTPTFTLPPSPTRPPIPVVSSPASPAGMILILGLAVAIAFSLRRLARS
jgi:hypothetical protein